MKEIAKKHNLAIVEDAAHSIEDAVIKIVGSKLKGVNAGEMGYSTTEVGDLIAESIV